MSDRKIEGVEACSNHGCVFGHPGGMGTNGQCHCLDIRPPEDRIRATRNVLALRAALTAERERAARCCNSVVEACVEYPNVGDYIAQVEAERDALHERVARLQDWVERAPHLGGCAHWSTIAFSREAFDQHYRQFGDGECTCGKSTALGDK